MFNPIRLLTILSFLVIAGCTYQNPDGSPTERGRQVDAMVVNYQKQAEVFSQPVSFSFVEVHGLDGTNQSVGCNDRLRDWGYRGQRWICRQLGSVYYVYTKSQLTYWRRCQVRAWFVRDDRVSILTRQVLVLSEGSQSLKRRAPAQEDVFNTPAAYQACRR